MAKGISGLLFVVLFIIADRARACSQPYGWKAKPIGDRAFDASWIVFGTVITEHIPTQPGGNATTDQEYKVRFEPKCWLKKPGSGDGPDTSDHEGPRTGDGGGGDSGTDDRGDRPRGGDGPERNRTRYDVGFRNLTVVEFKIDCVANDLQKGTEYILFLRKTEGKGNFTIDDVNTETGAIVNPADGDFAAIYRRLDAAKPGSPDRECIEGVEVVCFSGDLDEDLCSGGVAVGVAMLPLVLAAMVAIFG